MITSAKKKNLFRTQFLMLNLLAVEICLVYGKIKFEKEAEERRGK